VALERELQEQEAERASRTAAPTEEPLPALGPESELTTAGLLRMQAGAGNAAVARMLARQPVATETDDSKSKRATATRPADNVLTKTSASQTGSVSNAYGTFKYSVLKNAGSNGCSFSVSFQAFSPEVNSTKLTFIQTVKGHKAAGAPFYLNNDSTYYAPFDPDASGLYTDHLPGETDPFYNFEDKKSADESTGTTGASKTTMTDAPRIGSITGERGQTFETAPFALSGTDKGEFFGTLTWGWDIDAAGTFKLQNVAAHDDVSTDFGAALRKFIARMHDINKTGTTPAPVAFDMPGRVCRDLTTSEKASLKPTGEYVKGKANGRIWIVARYTDAKDLVGAKDNAQGVQQHFVNEGVPLERIRITHLEQPGGKAETTPIEVTVIDS
jgi:hypothetical protein